MNSYLTKSTKKKSLIKDEATTTRSFIALHFVPLRSG